MIKVLFVCHGNICRSPMAEFVLKDMVKKLGIEEQFEIQSAATSREEIGNSVHYGTRNKLAEYGISVKGKCAVQLTKQDYEKYDYLIGMEEMNIRNMMRILGDDPENKVYKLLDFTERKGDIADPWYTDNFDVTYNDILEGCRGFLKRIGIDQ
jgi:protein-tyrosine phosphatase